MIGAIGFLISVLAMIWARKNDVLVFMKDSKSHPVIKDNILFPENSSKKFMSLPLRFMDKYLENGFRFIGSVYIISLLYASVSLIISTRFDGGHSVFFETSINSYYSSMLIPIVFVSGLFIIIIGGHHSKKTIEELKIKESNYLSMSRKISYIYWKRGILYLGFAGCAVYVLSIWLTYRSVPFTLFTAFLACACLFSFKGYLPDSAIGGHRVAVFFGGCLAALGLMSASFSFAASALGTYTVISVMGGCILVGGLAYAASFDHEVYAKNGFPHRKAQTQLPRYRKILALLGRPSVYCAFYCIRCPGQFCAAVSIILLNVAFLKGMVPDTIVSAVTIILTCCVFFAGATTLAGAGIFAAFVMALIFVYMILSSASLDAIWASSFFLWVIFPLINLLIDASRWYIVKRNMKRYAQTGKAVPYAIFVLDIIMAVLFYLAFVFLLFFSVRMFNEAALSFNGSMPFPDGNYLSKLKSDPVGGGVWLYAMAFMIFLPTIVQSTLFLYLGFASLVPKGYRKDLYSKLISNETAYESDNLAWQISMVDVFGRIIFTLAIILLAITLLQELQPLFQLLTIKSAEFGFDAGNYVFNTGKAFASWLFKA